MSSLFSQARTRAPRLAEAALERARLTVVPARVPQVRRAPFAVLVLLLLAAGVVGLLMFNTQMQQGSFRATALQREADRLHAKQQQLAVDLERLRDPQHVAVEARRLGMVAPAVPAFVDLRTGKVIGKPTPATAADGVRIATGTQVIIPAELRPAPIVIKVLAPAESGQTSADSGPASDTQRAGEGRKNRGGAQAAPAPDRSER